MTEPAAPDFAEADLDDVVDLPPDEGDAGPENPPGPDPALEAHG